MTADRIVLFALGCAERETEDEFNTTDLFRAIGADNVFDHAPL